MHYYARLFQKILDSSIWLKSDTTRIAWVALLAMKDEEHKVYATIPNLAHRARISVEAARAAIEEFMAPDPDSSRPDFEGRRLEAIEGGWRLLNGDYYEQLARDESRRLYLRRKQREYRSRKKGCPSAREQMVERAAREGEDTDGYLRHPDTL